MDNCETVLAYCMSQEHSLSDTIFTFLKIAFYYLQVCVYVCVNLNAAPGQTDRQG